MVGISQAGLKCDRPGSQPRGVPGGLTQEVQGNRLGVGTQRRCETEVSPGCRTLPIGLGPKDGLQWYEGDVEY